MQEELLKLFVSELIRNYIIDNPEILEKSILNIEEMPHTQQPIQEIKEPELKKVDFHYKPIYSSPRPLIRHNPPHINPSIKEKPIPPKQPEKKKEDFDKIIGQYTNEIPKEFIESLSDPKVRSLECPGPDKNILMDKLGATIPLSFSLTKEQIDKFIENISEKTNTPIKEIMKTNLGPLSFVAVISEYAGTRFIIQKKMDYKHGKSN